MKTVAHGGDVAAFLAASAHAVDAAALDAMLRRVSGQEPAMWGPTIVGYGRYRYRYDSGREGEMARIGFSPRKPAIVLYLVEDFPRRQPLLDRLGKHKVGKSCLYVKRLADVDAAVLEELARESWAAMGAKYPG